jgi:hypothetical protein
MLGDACLQVVRARPTPVPIEQIWPAGARPALLRALMLAQRAGLLLAPALFGFQWIFVARPAVSRGAQSFCTAIGEGSGVAPTNTSTS